MNESRVGRLTQKMEQSWTNTSIPAKFIVWLAPILFTAGMLWVAFKDLPKRVYANEVLSKDNDHRIDLADQDRKNMAKTLVDMAVILKEIRDDQREEVRRMRRWREGRGRGGSTE